MDQENNATDSSNNNKTSNKKSNKTLLITLGIIGIVVIALASVSSFFAWNFISDKFGSEEAASNTVTGLIESATDGKVNINSSTGEVTVKNDSGESITNKSSLPDGFPSEVVIYSPSTIKGSFTSNQEGKTNWTVTIESNDPYSKVKTAITEQYAGWTKTAEFNSETSSVLNYTNGTYTVVINVTDSGNADGKTDAVYSVNTK
jgi:hypothetical protein